MIGLDHGKVGGHVMEKWNLPQIHQQVAVFHHSPGVAENNLEASIIHVADFVANSSEVGNDGETFIPPINSQALELIGVKREDLMGSILKRLLEEFQNAGQAFLQAI